MSLATGPVLLSDPRIAAIALRRVWRADGRRARRVCGSTAGSPIADGRYGLLRAGVVERLVAAESLLPKRLPAPGHRGLPPAEPAAARTSRTIVASCVAAHPDWDGPRCHVEASKFVAPPEVAPHQTGGAVDLTLCHDNGVELDLGTAVNASPEDERRPLLHRVPAHHAAARELRGELGRVLTAVGLVNYPTEWWHWSYGDRYWAHSLGRDRTLYAPIAMGVPGQRRGRRPMIEQLVAVARTVDPPGHGPAADRAAPLVLVPLAWLVARRCGGCAVAAAAQRCR